MDPQDYAMHQRMMDIYNQKIAMGFGDYDGMYGGWAKGSRGKPNAYNKFIQSYLKKYKNVLSHLLPSERLTQAAKAWNQFKVSNKASNIVIKKKRGRKSKTTYSPDEEQLTRSRLTKKQFLDMAEAAHLSNFQKGRVARRYKNRSATGRCLKPFDNGDYYLRPTDYKCIWKKEKKPLIKLKNNATKGKKTQSKRNTITGNSLLEKLNNSLQEVAKCKKELEKLKNVEEDFLEDINFDEEYLLEPIKKKKIHGV